MIYVTGDTHGALSMNRLNSNNFPQGKELTKNDYVIICGDFGLVWNNNGEDYWWRHWLDEKPWTTLFVDGNHENFDLLYQFPSQNKFGGIVRQISDSIFHLTRGQVFNIDGLKFFTMGGATSHDKGFRRDYVSWWPQEMPNYAEYEEALYNLEQNKWKVDYILTHCAPASIQKAINQSYQTDALTLFLEQIAAQTSYKKWYFGHYHMDFCIQKFQCLYNNIELIGGNDEISLSK